MPFSSLTVVIDNRAREEFRSSWGLSLLLEGEVTLLFDAGPSGDDLLHNLALCGCRPADIDVFFLSHSHVDHSGGLRALQGAGFTGSVVLSDYVPHNVSNIHLPWGEMMQPLRTDLTAIRLKYNSMHEQSLLAETALGYLLLVGCAHPGLEKIWDVSCTLTTPIGVIGGFHDSLPFPALQEAIVVGPCHCTKDLEAFRERFPSAFIDLAAGDRLVFGEESS
jgi:7,8-dihydropterin-6-yl-methyl-4-(beta-D-ribofuranosyl)aminobenzene 5'-phosphate synthase